jgi:PTH1 family peptidyl-tRNA hydrolase
MSGISILFGLGNPGRRYRRTRHNLGVLALDLLASRNGLTWEQGIGPCLVTSWKLESGDVTLLKSTTYMNESGKAVARLPGLDPARLIVVCDDLSLPLGMLRIRRQGGSGGHLGLESVIMSIETEGFARLRLGIGSPPPAIDWSEFVLMPFLLEELPDVERMIEEAADALEMVVVEGIEKAMQAYNRKASE